MRGYVVAQRVGLSATLALVVALTLVPRDAVWHWLGLNRCLACGDLSTVDSVHNLLLFVPLGIVLGSVLGNPRHAILAAGLLSGGIEVLQAAAIPGRVGSYQDAFINVTGAALGVASVGAGARWLLTEAHVARNCSLVMAMVFAGTLFGSGLLIQPAPLPPQQLYGQWAPRRANFEPLDGRVLGLQINGIPVGHGSIENQAGVRQALLRGPTRVRVEALAHQPQRANPVLLARLVAEDEEVFLVARRQRDYQVRVRLRSADFGLRTLTVSVPAPPAETGHVVVEFEASDREVVVRTADGVQTTSVRLGLEVSLGWVFLLPVEIAVGSSVHIVSAAWVGLLALPVGFFAAGAARRGPGDPAALRSHVAAGTVMALGLGLAPIVSSSAAPHWSAWLGSAAGVALGWLIGATVGRGLGGSRNEQVQPSP